MVLLNCAIVGKASVISIIIEEWKTVALLKDAISEKKKYQFPADELQLFVAKTADGKWLSDESDAALELAKGSIHQDILTMLRGEQTAVTKSLEYWLFEKNKMPQPSTAQIHVLVKIPDVDGKRGRDDANQPGDKSSPPRKKTAITCTPWELMDSDCPILTLDPSKRLVRIPWKLLKISGATTLEKGCDLQLYCRPEAINEWREIQRNAVDTNAQVIIRGAPGTGKTCAAFAFAFGAVDRDFWDIVWIHYDRDEDEFFCYMVKGQQLWAAEAWDARGLESLLFSGKLEERQTILFYDGYNEMHHASALIPCRKWRSRDRILRRLVIVTSMVSWGKRDRPDLYRRIDSHVKLPGEKVNPWLAALKSPTTQADYDGDALPDPPYQVVDSEMQDVEGNSEYKKCAVTEGMEADQSQQSEVLSVHVFELLSWTIDEYRIAVGVDEFFDSVELFLRDGGKAIGAVSTPYADRVALVDKKFYVSGGSARMMFALPTTRAIESLAIGFEAVESLKS